MLGACGVYILLSCFLPSTLHFFLFFSFFRRFLDDAANDEGDIQDGLRMSGKRRHRKAFARWRLIVINRACEIRISLLVNSARREQITDLTVRIPLPFACPPSSALNSPYAPHRLFPLLSSAYSPSSAYVSFPP